MIDRKYLPSKKFVLALSTAVALVLIALGISYLQNNSSTYSGTLTVNNASSTIAIANSIDSDGDGIPDWQEVLYGTDPHNPDTDGDGTPDGIEIKGNRDPLKANTAAVGQTPNDQIDPTIVAAEQKEVSDYESLNPTDKMAHDLFSNIIANQPTNGSMDPDTMNSLVTETINTLSQKQFTASTTADDLNYVAVTPATFDKNLATYKNNYLTQTQKLTQVLGQDLQIVSVSITTEKPIDTTKLAGIAHQYQSIVNALIAVPIPGIKGSQGANNYLSIITDLEDIIAIDNDIINSKGDAVTTYADFIQYNRILTDLTNTLSIMDNALHITR